MAWRRHEWPVSVADVAALRCALHHGWSTPCAECLAVTAQRFPGALAGA